MVSQVTLDIIEAKEPADLLRQIGFALINWAGVEAHLLALFRHLCGNEGVANEIWASVVSLDAKLKMLQRLINKKLDKNSEIYGDAINLLNETRSPYARRNEIAHATMVRTVSKQFVLEPYFIETERKPHFSLTEVRDRGRKFFNLSQSLDWLIDHIKALPSSPQTPPTTSATPPPDLVLALRNAESQRRKEQSERAQLLRLAQRLQKEGRLPAE